MYTVEQRIEVTPLPHYPITIIFSFKKIFDLQACYTL